LIEMTTKVTIIFDLNSALEIINSEVCVYFD
jgi:hypothetical protein